MPTSFNLRFDLRHRRVLPGGSFVGAHFIQPLHHEIFERIRFGFRVHGRNPGGAAYTSDERFSIDFHRPHALFYSMRIIRVWMRTAEAYRAIILSVNNWFAPVD